MKNYFLSYSVSYNFPPFDGSTVLSPPVSQMYFLKHIRHCGTKEDFGFQTCFKRSWFFAESCWRRNCWSLNRYKESIFQEKLLKFGIVSKSTFNVILLQILQVFYSEDFQKKMAIKYGLPNVDRENTWKVFRPFLFAFRDICSLKLYLIMLFVTKLL